MQITVARAIDGDYKNITTTVKPWKAKDGQVIMGVGILLDMENAIVARTIDADGFDKLEIPAGARITKVAGVEVSSFYDVVEAIRERSGERVGVVYRVDEKIAGSVAINIDAVASGIKAESMFTAYAPLKNLKWTFKASGPFNAVAMGYKQTLKFVSSSYATIKALLTGSVSPKNLMGPVGIIAFSSQIIAERDIVDYLYFLALINALIAVFNFLPLPILDGGHIILLIIERVKGSPLNYKVQEIITYAGLILIGGLFLYITGNDIIRVIFK